MHLTAHGNQRNVNLTSVTTLPSRVPGSASQSGDTLHSQAQLSHCPAALHQRTCCIFGPTCPCRFKKGASHHPKPHRATWQITKRLHGQFTPTWQPHLINPRQQCRQPRPDSLRAATHPAPSWQQPDPSGSTEVIRKGQHAHLPGPMSWNSTGSASSVRPM